MKRPRPSTSVIDVSGGQVGGAARFREELDLFVASTPKEVAPWVIGSSSFVTPPWLLRREVLARSGRRVVAANNVSFVLAGSERWVLARNANHFLTAQEWSDVAALHPPSFPRQVAMVRAAIRRADVIVAPSGEMAERIASVLPAVADRVLVRFHPFTPSVRRDQAAKPFILVPIVWSAYKQLDHLVAGLLDAIRDRPDHSIWWTASRQQVGESVRDHPQLRLIGQTSHDQMAELYASAAAVFYPTEIESFGYPLAEARAIGIPIIARNTERTREIAGPALRGFDVSTSRSLATAVTDALSGRPEPDPDPFDRTSYFRWLVGT